MNRLDGQGHHPWIRPHNFHTKKARAKLKVIRQVLPKAQQIAMMKLGIGFVPTEGNCFVLGKLIEWDFLISSETTQEEPICLDMSCGEVGDYAMLDAVPSRPPPKHGWTYKVIRHSAVLFLAALMALATACKKAPTPEPTPTPNQPTDTVTPNDTTTQIVPTREIVIPWSWEAGEGYAPPKDTIEFYAKDPTVKYVFIHLICIQNMGSTREPKHYRKARDTLLTRIDIDSTKVHGRGEVKVGRDGAHIHPDTLTKKFGMWEPDSLWFAKHGWQVKRYNRR